MPPEPNQPRKMVQRVLNFMNKEAQEGFQYDLKATYKRTYLATGVSESTIRRIVNLAKNPKTPSSSRPAAFRSSYKKTYKIRDKTVTGIDDFDKGAIRRMVHNFYETEHEVPTLKNLFTKVQQELGYKGSISSLRRILLVLGLKWKKTEDSNRLLIEDTNIRIKRIEYLRKITRFREDNRPIVYTIEAHIDSTYKYKSQRLIILHAGFEAGFVPNSLLMFIADKENSDFRYNMNYEKYEKWIRTQLIPNLPINSVLVIDGSLHYTNKERDTAPTANCKRSVMESWLADKNIPFHSSMLKPELYRLICLHKEKFKTYAIDCILTENNHTVLRFPPNHHDLNPLKIVWTQIKDNFLKKNVNRDLDMRLVAEEVNIMSEQKLSVKIEEIKNIEEQYKKSDINIDNLLESFVICEELDKNDKNSEYSNSSSDEEDCSSGGEDV